MSEQKRPITAEDLYNAQQVGDPQISPDGQHVIFTVQRVERKTEKKYTNLWLAATDGSSQPQICIFFLGFLVYALHGKDNVLSIWGDLRIAHLLGVIKIFGCNGPFLLGHTSSSGFRLSSNDSLGMRGRKALQRTRAKCAPCA